MQSKAKIVLQVVTDAQQAKKQAKNIGESVAKSAEKGAKKLTFGAKVKENLDKIKVGVENIGIGGDKLSKLGQLFKGGGWIAVATAAIGLLAKGAMDLWDKMTVSAEQAIAKAKTLRQYSQQKMDTAFKNESDSKGYVQRLKQLNQQQELSNLQKMQAITIVNQLSKTYGDLGLSISTVTGKVLGLDQAMEQIAKRNKMQKQKQAVKKVANSTDEANAVLDPIFEDIVGGWFSQAFKNGFMQYFSEFQKNRSEVFKKGINAKMNENFTYEKKYTGDMQYHWQKRQLTEDEKKVAQQWNSGLQGKVQFLEKALANATTADQKQKLETAISTIKQLIKDKKQLDSINKTGFKSQEEYIQHLKKQNQQTEKLRANIKKQAEQRLKARKTKEQTQFYNSLTPTSTKIAYKQVQKSNLQSELNPLMNKKNKIQLQLQIANDQLKKAFKKGDADETAKLMKKVNDLTKQLASAEDEVSKKQGSILDIQTEINNLQKKQADEKFKQIKADEEKIKKLKQQLELQKQKQAKAIRNSKIQDDDNKNVDAQKKELKKEKAVTLKKLGVGQFLDQFQMQQTIENLKKQLESAVKSNDKNLFNETNKKLVEAQRKLQKIKKYTQQWFVGADPLPSYEGSKQDWLNDIKRVIQAEKQLKQLQKKKGGKQKKDEYDKQALQAKMRQLQIEAQIEELNKRSVKYYQQQNENLDKELAVEKLILQGKYQEAEKQRLINQLKEQGLKVDQKQIDAIMKKKKELNSLNVDKQLKNQGQSLLDKFGLRDKNSRYQKRVRQLQQANKTSLTDDQKQKVKTLVDLQIKTEQLEKLKPNFSDLQIKTNQLTARGGFAGGAVVPNIDAVNKQIRDYEAKSYSTLTQIKQLLSKGGVI